MKCSKLIVTLGLGLVAGVLFGDVTNDYSAALRLFNDKKYAESEAAFAKLQTDYPAADVNLLAQAQMSIGNLYRVQKKPTLARTAYQKAIKDYPNAPADIMVKIECYAAGQLLPGRGAEGIAQALAEYRVISTNYPACSVTYKASVQHKIGTMLLLQKKYAEAQVVFEDAIKAYPAIQPEFLVAIMASDYTALKGQGKIAEANKMLADRIILNATKCKQTGGVLLKDFDRILPTKSSAVDYMSMLVEMLKAVPATEANAEFLGKVKSEYEKVR